MMIYVEQQRAELKTKSSAAKGDVLENSYTAVGE